MGNAAGNVSNILCEGKCGFTRGASRVPWCTVRGLLVVDVSVTYIVPFYFSLVIPRRESPAKSGTAAHVYYIFSVVKNMLQEGSRL